MTLIHVVVPAGEVTLHGDLQMPREASGVVLFAHGSGSGRFSPRNQFVAQSLGNAGLATLLMDLLTDDEAEDRQKVFDIDLLAERLQAGVRWVTEHEPTRGLAVGLFGASTGAGAALKTAAFDPKSIAAVVSRGGRPDLAWDELPSVQAPTLLIVGGDDHEVVQLNRRAWQRLRCPANLEIVPGATHLFAEPGALEKVAALAGDWFQRHFAGTNVEKSHVSQS